MSSSSKTYLSYDQYKKREKEMWLEAEKGDGQNRRRSASVSTDKMMTTDRSPNRVTQVAKDENNDEYTQHITIMKNPAAGRRKSITNYAFPELHSSRKSPKKKVPENLLMVTRTRTDAQGRRHSVTVPLIPPADGEKFEGGYHISRNPITGGARLIAPSPTITVTGSASGKKDDSKSSLSPGSSLHPGSWRHRHRRHSIQAPSRRERMDQIKKGNSIHSKMDHLSSNMEKLSVSPTTHSKKWAQRRSSKQGFLHFLDLAIAN